MSQSNVSGPLLVGSSAETTAPYRTQSTSSFRGVNCIRAGAIAVTASTTSGQVLAWANPEGQSILVLGLFLDITTASSGACTLDIGVAADAVTSNDSLIDGASAAAAGVLNSASNAGTNGRMSRKVTSSQYVTFSVASGDANGLVADAYIEYIPLTAG